MNQSRYNCYYLHYLIFIDNFLSIQSNKYIFTKVPYPPAPCRNTCFFSVCKTFSLSRNKHKNIIGKKFGRKKSFNKLHAVSRGVCPEKGKKNIFILFQIPTLVYHYVPANVFIKVIFS